MKNFIIFSFILILESLYCIQLTGIKFEVTEEMAYKALYHFYPEINKKIKDMDIEDIHVSKGVNLRDIKVGIPNFTIDKVKFKFSENGINIKISDLKASLFVRAYVSKLIIPFTKHAEGEVNSFNLELNLGVSWHTQENSKLIIPRIVFTEPPKHNIDLDVNIGGFVFGLNGALESLAKGLLKDAINNFIKNKFNDFLQAAIDKLKYQTAIDEEKGYYIDYSLTYEEPIKMKNGFLEINCFAFFYNEKIDDTKNKKRIPLTYIPDITPDNTQYQLYISEYSINSALYTYFKTDPLSLTLDSKIFTPLLLGGILPQLYQSYGNDQLYIDFKTKKESDLALNNNGITGNIYGQIAIKVKGTNEIVFQCNLDLTTEVEIIVKNEITITGKINNLSIKVGEISENKCNTQVLIEQNINKLISLILPLANEIIESGIKYTLPIFFKDISIEHKKGYIGIEYMIKDEINYDKINSISKEALNYLTLYIDNNFNTMPLDEMINLYKNDYIYEYFKKKKSLKNTLYLICNRIRDVLSNVKDSSLNTYLSELTKYILDINKYAEIEELSLLNTKISNFIDLIKASNKPQLKQVASEIINLSEKIMIKLINSATSYFILEDDEE